MNAALGAGIVKGVGKERKGRHTGTTSNQARTAMEVKALEEAQVGSPVSFCLCPFSHPCIPGGDSLVSATSRGNLPGRTHSGNFSGVDRGHIVNQKRDRDSLVISRSGPRFPHLYNAGIRLAHSGSAS